jgi:hypothetical protein
MHPCKTLRAVLKTVGVRLSVEPENHAHAKVLARETALLLWSGLARECRRLCGAGIRGQARSYNFIPCGLSTVSRCTP